MTFQDGYELLEHSTLGQIRRLLHAHWSLFKSRFTVQAGQPMALGVFLNKFDRIEKARNTVYHHVSFGGMTDIYLTAEELLDCIGFRLAEVHPRIAATKCQPPPYFPP